MQRSAASQPRLLSEIKSESEDEKVSSEQEVVGGVCSTQTSEVSSCALPRYGDIRRSPYRVLPYPLLRPAAQHLIGAAAFQTSLFEELRVTTTVTQGWYCQSWAVARAAEAAGRHAPDGQPWDGPSLHKELFRRICTPQWRARLEPYIAKSGLPDAYGQWTLRVYVGTHRDHLTLLVLREIVDLPIVVIHNDVAKGMRTLHWPAKSDEERANSPHGIGGPCIALVEFDEQMHYEVLCEPEWDDA